MATVSTSHRPSAGNSGVIVSSLQASLRPKSASARRQRSRCVAPESVPICWPGSTRPKRTPAASASSVQRVSRAIRASVSSESGRSDHRSSSSAQPPPENCLVNNCSLLQQAATRHVPADRRLMLAQSGEIVFATSPLAAPAERAAGKGKWPRRCLRAWIDQTAQGRSEDAPGPDHAQRVGSGDTNPPGEHPAAIARRHGQCDHAIVARA